MDLKRRQQVNKIDYRVFDNIIMNGANPALKQFSKLSVIGKGTYAKVVLVRHLKDNQLYALKELKKKYILEKNQ